MLYQTIQKGMEQISILPSFPSIFPMILILLTIWFFFHLSYGVYQKTWAGFYFIANVSLNVVLLSFIYKSGISIATASGNTASDVQLLIQWSQKLIQSITQKEDIFLIAICWSCFLLLFLIHIGLFWHISHRFTWKYTQNPKIQSSIHIILFVIFLISPVFPILIVAYLPFEYRNTLY